MIFVSKHIDMDYQNFLHLRLRIKKKYIKKGKGIS